MKKALIATNELVFDHQGNELGQRVAQVESSENIFETTSNLIWVDCSNEVVADQFYWNGYSCVIVPVPPLANTANVTV